MGGDGDDLVSVDGDALAVEGWSGDLALADVAGGVGGDEAFAEEELHASDGALLHVAVGVVDEDALDVARVVDEDDGRAHEFVLSDVAVGLEEMLEEEDRGAELDPGLEGVEGKGEAQAGDCFGDALRPWLVCIRVREAGFGRVWIEGGCGVHASTMDASGAGRTAGILSLTMRSMI